MKNKIFQSRVCVCAHLTQTRHAQKACAEMRRKMVKHVILWQLKDSFTEEEKAEIKAGIKAGLEGLAGQIPGLLSIQVHTEGLPSSNADLMLDSCFADAASLKGYSVHPAHVAVADGKVRPNVKCRVCMDYEVTEA